ncbi:DUF4097 family beta strand repeat-containing protein [Fodinicola feengrottensis]|uniref:hypothetical protein n=1 Tax=Fodinicola feengrottensis TaxID=435914 RepID=UPI0013D431CA|nr:hypothetical protein [Fodinicola feengrottensis]
MTAESVNGKISANFLDAPTMVTVSSVNGSVDVYVPGTATYRVTTHTVTSSDKVKVPTSDTSPHVINASSTNGSVQVFS